MSADDTQLKYEDTYVHQIYDEIASHFSSTRFKPWPVVDEFLKSLPTGAVGLDIGCGNGKYLTVRKDVFMIASDRSPELLKFALQHQPHSAVVGDVLNLPHQNGIFDFAICIAVVHHLSTPERRQEGIRAILATLRRPGSDRDEAGKDKAGQALVFVWALEQKSSRRGWDTGMDQDVLVPWVLKTEHDRARNHTPNRKAVRTPDDSDSKPDACDDAQTTDGLSSAQSQSQSRAGERTFNRYYHLYRQGELEHDIATAGGKVVRSGYDRDNWWAVFEPA